MNVVFLVESYHHKALINGICVKKIAEALVNEGHKVTVFSSSGDERNLPEKEEVNGVKVYRIKRNTLTSIVLYAKEKQSKCLNKFKDIYAQLRFLTLFWFWPLNSFFTHKRYYKKMRKYLNDEKTDVIVGTYFNLEEVLAAIKFKEKNPDALLITYTLDAMAGRESPVFFRTDKIARKSIQRWERYVLNKTDIFCAMEAHREYFNNTSYPDKIKNKIHYLDIPLLDLSDKDCDLLPKGEIKNIVYTGATSLQTGSAGYLIELMNEVENAEFHMYGYMGKDVKTILKESKLEGDKVFYHGRITHDEVVKIQQNADFLVTFGSVNPCMISGKIFEYMARKKPIICFYQIENDINIPYLKKYPNVLFINEKSRDKKEDIKKLTEFLNRVDFVDIDNSYLIKEFYKNTPKAMVDEIVNSKKEKV